MPSKKTEQYSRLNVTLPPTSIDKLEYIAKLNYRGKSNMVYFLIESFFDNLTDEQKKEYKRK